MPKKKDAKLPQWAERILKDMGSPKIEDFVFGSGYDNGSFNHLDVFSFILKKIPSY